MEIKMNGKKAKAIRRSVSNPPVSDRDYLEDVDNKGKAQWYASKQNSSVVHWSAVSYLMSSPQMLYLYYDALPVTGPIKANYKRRDYQQAKKDYLTLNSVERSEV